MSQIQEYEEACSTSIEDLGVDDTRYLWKIPIVARLASALSIREFAQILEVDERQLRRWESGEFRSCSISKFQRILAKLEEKKLIAVNQAYDKA